MPNNDDFIFDSDEFTLDFLNYTDIRNLFYLDRSFDEIVSLMSFRAKLIFLLEEFAKDIDNGNKGVLDDFVSYAYSEFSRYREIGDLDIDIERFKVSGEVSDKDISSVLDAIRSRTFEEDEVRLGDWYTSFTSLYDSHKVVVPQMDLIYELKMQLTDMSEGTGVWERFYS